MRKLIMVLILGLVFILPGCGGGGDDSGNFKDLVESENPGIGDETPTDPRLAKLSLNTSRFKVNTDNSNQATLTVIAADQNNAALSDVPVRVRSSAGLLSHSEVTTGPDGTANFSFRAGAEKENQVAAVTAGSGTMEQTIPITIEGTAIQLTAPKNSLVQNDPEGLPLTAQVFDAGGVPVFGRELTFTSEQGNSISGTDAGGNPVSGPSISLTSDTNGRVNAVFSGDLLGMDTISVQGLGAQKDIALNVTDPNSGFSSPEDRRIVLIGDPPIPVSFVLQENGAPVSGADIIFAANSGTFGNGLTTQEMTTGSDGQAEVQFTAGNFPALANIEANRRNPDDSLTLLDTLVLDIRAVDPDRLDLQVSPAVLPPSVGDTTASSTITATVRDANDNLVQGAQVNFWIASGPGGGETLSPLVAMTDENGQAVTTFTSGSVTSPQDGVIIRATVTEAPQFVDEVTLTIGQESYRIVLGTSNRIELVNINDSEIGYALPITALITDNNSNPVPHQKVSLHLYPTFYRTGFWTTFFDETDPCLAVYKIDDVPHCAMWSGSTYMNEDRNRNGILDSGEDGWIPTELDEPGFFEPGISSYPLNGILDPGNVASIPAEVITDENGLALFKIVYAKAFGIWTDVEISASTEVQGSETKSRIPRLTLPWMVNPGGEADAPLINSPFNF